MARSTARIAEAHYMTGMYDPQDMSNVAARLWQSAVI
jgi:hypothetical protein